MQVELQQILVCGSRQLQLISVKKAAECRSARVQTRVATPTDEAVSKLFYRALNNISKKWMMPIRDWKAELSCFAIHLEDRVPQA